MSADVWSFDCDSVYETENSRPPVKRRLTCVCSALYCDRPAFSVMMMLA